MVLGCCRADSAAAVCECADEDDEDNAAAAAAAAAAAGGVELVDAPWLLPALHVFSCESSRSCRRLFSLSS